MLNLLKSEQSTRKKIFKYFKYDEQVFELPFRNLSLWYWATITYPNGVHVVRYAKTKQGVKDAPKGLYREVRVFHNPYLNKWFYQGKEFTMIGLVYATQDVKFLGIFRNNREVCL